VGGEWGEGEREGGRGGEKGRSTPEVGTPLDSMAKL